MRTFRLQMSFSVISFLDDTARSRRNVPELTCGFKIFKLQSQNCTERAGLENWDPPKKMRCSAAIKICAAVAGAPKGVCMGWPHREKGHSMSESCKWVLSICLTYSYTATVLAHEAFYHVLPHFPPQKTKSGLLLAPWKRRMMATGGNFNISR